jgi:hypothetical protein
MIYLNFLIHSLSDKPILPIDVLLQITNLPFELFNSLLILLSFLTVYFSPHLLVFLLKYS